MHGLICLTADFSIDSGTMNHSFTSLHGSEQLFLVLSSDEGHSYARLLTQRFKAWIHSPGNEHHVMPSVQKRPGQGASNKSGPSCNGDFHEVCFLQFDAK
jgi:hypothetical protein